MAERTDDDIPEDVRRFVLTSIPSVPYLEALLLLRAHRAPLDAATLAARLYIGEDRAATLIHALRDARLVTPEGDAAGAFRYAPASPELDALVARVAACYATHLLAVTRLIHSNTERKARRFADAFKLRKD
jgi:hypothetical protein